MISINIVVDIYWLILQVKDCVSANLNKIAVVNDVTAGKMFCSMDMLGKYLRLHVSVDK